MRIGIPLVEITTERLWQEIQNLQSQLNTHNHLSFGSNILSGTVDGYLQSANFVSGSTGWQLNPDGSVEALSATIIGTITATAGAIGGWNINATSIYTGTEDQIGRAHV